MEAMDILSLDAEEPRHSRKVGQDGEFMGKGPYRGILK